MSLEANDILIRVRQFMMNKFNGFDQCLKEYQNNNEKSNCFIKQCQYLVEKGWDENIDCSEEEVDFFSGVLKPLLVNPAKSAFQNKNISADNEKVIKYFTRLALLRMIFDAHTKYLYVYNPCDWFNSVKSHLDKEFTSLCSVNITYSREKLNNLKELDNAIIEKKCVRQNYRKNISPIIWGVAAFYCVFKYTKDLFSPQVRMSIFFLFTACFLYYKYHQLNYFSASHDLTLFNQRKQEFEGNIKLSLDQNIKKFFFIADEEIKRLSEVGISAVINNQEGSSKYVPVLNPNI